AAGTGAAPGRSRGGVQDQYRRSHRSARAAVERAARAARVRWRAPACCPRPAQASHARVGAAAAEGRPACTGTCPRGDASASGRRAGRRGCPAGSAQGCRAPGFRWRRGAQVRARFHAATGGGGLAGEPARIVGRRRLGILLMHAQMMRVRLAQTGMRMATAVLAMAALLSGCMTTGRNFDASQLSALTPGVSTMDEAAYALGAAPQTLYGQSDGSTLALWSYHATWVTDGLYGRKQALLRFGPDGRLLGLVDSTN